MIESASLNSTTHKVECPRCGYDLRGVVSSWRDTSPLIGKCSECGLSLEWSELLSRDQAEPAWCVEFQRDVGFPIDLCAMKDI